MHVFRALPRYGSTCHNISFISDVGLTVFLITNLQVHTCSLLRVKAVNVAMCYEGGRYLKLVLLTAYLGEFLMVFVSPSRQLLG
jgi:hypothetical protein